MDLDAEQYRVAPGHRIHLADTPTAVVNNDDKKEIRKETDRLLARLSELQDRLFAEGKARVLVVLQATDTGGKDGTIKKVFGSVNPQGLRVAGFKAPTATELAHDYLRRAHAEVPGDGGLTVFNRSHYEDVLIVRVHNLVPRPRWRKRYRHIRDFERMLADEGTTIVKFFLHISKDEQRQRLQERVNDPAAQWKFNPTDLAEREHWDAYQSAYEDMVSETSTGWAPWYVVPADHKWYRDYVVARVMVDVLEQLDPQWPLAPQGIDGIVIP